MIKRDSSGRFLYYDEGFFVKKRLYKFHSGNSYTESGLEEVQYKDLLMRQKSTPIIVMRSTTSKKRWWMFMDEFYWEDENYTAEEIRILILDRIEQKSKKIKRAQARLSQNKSVRNEREIINDDVKLFVWQRDGGKCVRCGSNLNLEFDHIIPLAKGGSNTARNIQLLCEICNRAKGANLF